MIDIYNIEKVLDLFDDFRITERAYRQYIEKVNKGIYMSGYEVRKKMVRNLLLAEKMKSDYSKDLHLYKYGSMGIMVAGNKIIKVNNKSYGGGIKYKKEDKEHLNKILKIYN